MALIHSAYSLEHHKSRQRNSCVRFGVGIGLECDRPRPGEASYCTVALQKPCPDQRGLYGDEMTACRALDDLLVFADEQFSVFITRLGKSS